MIEQPCCHPYAKDRQCQQCSRDTAAARDGACRNAESPRGRTLSRTEVRTQLEDYLAELESEAAAVREIIGAMKTKDGGH